MLNYEPRYGEYIISRGFQPSDPDQLNKQFLKCFFLKATSFGNVFLLTLISSKKRTKTRRIEVIPNSFVRFLEEFTAWQFAFKINWPLSTLEYLFIYCKQLNVLKLFSHFTVQINCRCGPKVFENSWPSAFNFQKFFSQSLQQLFLAIGVNNFRNKIPKRMDFILQSWTLQLNHKTL